MTTISTGRRITAAAAELPAAPPPRPFPPVPDLPAAVERLLAQIPRGRVTTFRELARALGDDQARSARWLGTFLLSHPHRRGCPCHRVVRVTGEIGRHISGDAARKAGLLQREGVAVSAAGRVDVSQPFDGFESDRPLARLQAAQREWAAAFCEAPLPGPPRTVAGVDVAYRADGSACGAYVLLSADTHEVLDEFTCALPPVGFPYLPGYLTWRELPILWELCIQARAAGRLGDVIICDGNGRLHPWRAGIAVCLGVVLEHPVIGVGKSLLCGRQQEPGDPADVWAPVLHQQETIGAALFAASSQRPVYISAGHRISLAEAVQLSRSLTRGRRLPEPIALADRLAKRLKREGSAAGG